MSANNWTQCPRCYIVNREKADEKDKIASEAYGKVSPEQFDTLRDEAKSFLDALPRMNTWDSAVKRRLLPKKAYCLLPTRVGVPTL
jgi:hypothetical protein